MHIEIETKDNGVLTSEATGLTESVQAASVRVSTDGVVQRHIVVMAKWAHDPSIFPAIRKLFPDSTVSVVLGGRIGEDTIACEAVEAATLRAAAAAVGTVKRSWGWDESPEIRVVIANVGRTFVVSPFFENGSWHVGEVAAA
jgi:hypothetical protein